MARLESFSPTRIWASLRGSRDADLAREQAEQQAAEYDVARAEALLDQATAEHDAILASRQALGDVDARRERALSAREQLLSRAGGTVGEELAAIAAEVADVRSRLTEVREAIDASAQADARLAAAAGMLGKARDWSTYDTFLDGGFIGDMMKYDRMDQAAALMRQADQAMRRLSAELADVGMAAVGGIEVSNLVQAFDVWFDNLFSDWSVRNRIIEAADRTHQARAAVHQVRTRLAGRSRELEAAEALLRDRRERLLLPA